MASVFKSKGSAKYTILYTDENGHRRKKTGATDKAVSERMAHDIENKVAMRNQGLIDPAAEAYRDNEVKPLAQHIADWQADLIAKGNTPKHAEHTSNRSRRLVAVMLGSAIALRDHRRLPPRERGTFSREIALAIGQARLPDLIEEKVQGAIAKLKDFGWSLQTCNHYRASIKAFSKWCCDKHRTREDELRGVKGFNAKKDRRHDRRSG